jgi:serine/threonine-protein kinase HipA
MSAIDVVYEGRGGPREVARAAQQRTETFIEYTGDHIAWGVDLAPIHHPTTQRARRFVGRDPDHLPGLLADSLPDSWGRLVLRRDMRRHGIEQPTSLQMLTWLGRRTMGALTYRPVDGPPADQTPLVDLDRIQNEALRQLTGEESRDDEAAALTRAAGSGAGGARPKITVAYTRDGQLVVDSGTVPNSSTPWLVKFHGPDDPNHLSVVEATYLQLAAAAGITTCEHRLVQGSSGTRYLAVRRFDRAKVDHGQPQRIHMATAAGLLERYPRFLDQVVGYSDVIRLTRRVTGDVRDVAELVRRAVFNVVMHNRDDHARNFAYLWDPTGGWRLAPAYDLTHSLGPRPVHIGDGPGEHYLDVAGKGTDITRDDLHTLAQAADCTTDDIDRIIDRTLDVAHGWTELATGNGLDLKTVRQIAARLPALRG